ncbi:hypothetical protein GobsT_37740 [Gemmata obscuriglobus]|uniref:Uncharacterized protein n=1 Tax=Gemmata obscuriglobus TaxID=114 RepID=A0A2Z3GWL5_9BACT|nr:hypothetical protein [Gemmata obscuriglobus]AWM38133.1 hypothetical protein C1280_14775 [Gemmata obscuriglobus]QEG28985.1 hypothetical protein GobsT_37740 [Gemmata obscuriglobus]VTS07545.1 Uncharacterized protein OS=Planctomyces brasiliensis (strain ATCC 49424 / DSM 5305 / JCM 21570 / NBRC 103401 / IFAM 1448) GN=Plabr_0231 PE=4 SV=1 [Gemmata obscuriglobus UQM 2246]
MSDALYIDDGYTLTHDVPAVPGLHPAVRVVYRPALDAERKKYDAKLAARDPDAVERHECDLIARHVSEINDEAPGAFRAKLPKMHPTVRAVVLNLVLGFTPAKRIEAEGNSGGVSGC